MTSDLENVFGRTDDFAQEATLRKRGDSHNTVADVLVTVTWGYEDANRRSQDATVHTPKGKRANDEVILDIWTEDVETHEDDVWELEDGTILNAVRLLSKEPETGAQAWVCIRPRGISTKQSRISP